MDDVVLWRPTGQAELDLVAGSGWREWPPRLPDQPIFYPVVNREYAARIAREWNASGAEGVGYVTRFAVEAEFLSRYPVQSAGGRGIDEHWVPAEELEEFNRHVVGRIEVEAEYRSGVDASGVAGLPAAWVDYLGGPSWLRRGLRPSGEYLRLYGPEEIREVRPGLVVGELGSDGWLAFDLERPANPLVVVGGRDLAPGAAEFVAVVEDGTLAWNAEESWY